MQIHLKLKPTIFRKPNREAALSTVKRNMSIVHSSVFGVALQMLARNAANPYETVRVYSIQKIRAKSVETGKLKKDFFEGFTIKVKEKKLIRRTQVEVVYYDIPIAILKLMGKKVKQGSRTWRFV